MSAARILLAPTHRTGVALAITAALAEVMGQQERQVRYHQLGATSPTAVWDRWEGSSFLDPALYGLETMLELYDSMVHGADLSLVATNRGLLDESAEGGWTPAGVAQALECPVVLVVDCRGWAKGMAALVEGFRARSGDNAPAGIILTGVQDRSQREALRRALDRLGIPVVGCMYAGDGPGWDSVAPGAWSLPLGLDVVESVHRQVDASGLERLAGQRGFFPPLAAGHGRVNGGDGPLIMVAGGRGFTPWSRDSIELLRAAGARIKRLDLARDESLPPETAGVVLAGHLWVEALPELAANYQLMRELRVCAGEGMPMLALGGGMLYLLRRVQDDRGRSFDLAGLLPAEGEMIGDLDEATYLDVEVKRDCLLFAEGERMKGWVSTDAEIMEAPASRSFPFTVSAAGWESPQSEGALARNLLCSRVLVHLASVPQSARRFVAACERYVEA
ncbi:MAG TPA: hypothetical protein VFD74_00640 [Thermoleophilia bacterium]|nr:hypothetical protein [Thermoleophilia bacterium]